MASAAITLSGNGQIEIPKEIRDALHWQTGTELVLVSKPDGVTISTVEKPTRRRFADLIGLLKHEGPALSDEALCAAVDLNEDQEWRRVNQGDHA